MERDVACHQGDIDECAAVSDRGVMSQVAAGHEQVVVANLGDAAPLNSSAVHGHELAKDVPVADPHRCRLAIVAAVLRALAQDRSVTDKVVRSHRERTIQARMRVRSARSNTSALPD